MPMNRKKVETINSKCHNNWKFDVVYYMYHQERDLIKKVKLKDNTGYLECRLFYNSKNQISLNINKFDYNLDKKIATSESLGTTILMENTSYRKRNTNNLIIMTQRLTDKELLNIIGTVKLLNIKTI